MTGAAECEHALVHVASRRHCMSRRGVMVGPAPTEIYGLTSENKTLFGVLFPAIPPPIPQ